MEDEKQSREEEHRDDDAPKSTIIMGENLQPLNQEDGCVAEEETAACANKMVCSPEHDKHHQDTSTDANLDTKVDADAHVDVTNPHGNEPGNAQLHSHHNNKQALAAKPDDGQPKLKLFPESIIKRVVKRTLDQISSRIDPKSNPHKKLKSTKQANAIGNVKPKESHVLVVKEANMAINAASCVFVNYVMAMAIEMALEQKKRTVSREHVLMALCEMEFQDIAVALLGWKHEKEPPSNAGDEEEEEKAVEAEREAAKESDTAA